MADLVTPAKAGLLPGSDPGFRGGNGTGRTGTLAGIARHAFKRAPIEVVERVAVTVEGGIDGDHRGARKPGGTGKRQVTLLERGDWAAVMARVGRNIPWWERRSNLLVEGLDLPQLPGTMLRLGAEVVLEITRCCDPCERMDALAPGLFAAMDGDWRGGACARVIAGGTLHLNDVIRIEKA